jgi:hypothetical protein
VVVPASVLPLALLPAPGGAVVVPLLVVVAVLVVVVVVDEVVDRAGRSRATRGPASRPRPPAPGRSS